MGSRILLAAALAAVTACSPKPKPSEAPVPPVPSSAPDPSPDFVPASFGPCLPKLTVPRENPFTGAATCAPSGFCFDHPLPQGNDLGRAFLVGDEIWVTVPWRVQFPEYADFLASERARIHRFRGSDWRSVVTPFLPMLVTPPGDMWGEGPFTTKDSLGYFHGSIARWADADDWMVVTLPALGPVDIAGTGRDDIWAEWHLDIGTQGLAQWDGRGWLYGRVANLERFVSFSASRGMNAWVVPGFRHEVYRFDGSEWIEDRVGFDSDFVRTHAPNDTWVFSKTNAAHFDGIGWQQFPTGLPSKSDRWPSNAYLREAWWDRPDNVWAVGDAGMVLHFDGAAFTVVDVGVRAALWGIAGAADDLWAVGEAGTILHWNGTRWAVVSSGLGMDLRDVWGSGDDDVWAVGDVILHRDPHGWETIAAAPAPLRGVSGTGPADVWAVGDGGTAIHFDGTCWRPTSVPLALGDPIDLTSVWAATPDAVYAVGSAGRSASDNRCPILRWTGAGWSRIWEEANCGSGRPPIIRGSNPDDLWITGPWAGTLHLSGGSGTYVPITVGGASALVVWSPTDVLALAGYTVQRWNGHVVTMFLPADVGRYFSAAAAGPTALWLASGDLDPDLVRFDGQFARVVTPSNRPLRAIWVSESGTVFAVGDCGVILRGPGQ